MVRGMIALLSMLFALINAVALWANPNWASFGALVLCAILFMVMTTWQLR